MPSLTTITELRNMSTEELVREGAQIRSESARIKMGLTLQREKDHAKYQRLKKQIARIETVLSDRRINGLNKTSSPSTMPAQETKKKKAGVKRTAKKTSASAASSPVSSKKK